MSLRWALFIRYVATTLLVVLVLAIGIAACEYRAFQKTMLLTIGAARDDALTMVNQQLRAGRSLRDASRYAGEHLKRPNFFLYTVSDVPLQVVYNGVSAEVSPKYAAALFFTRFASLTHDIPRHSSPVPGGLVYVDPNYGDLSVKLGRIYLRLLPFVVIVLVLGYLVADKLSRRAVEPLYDATQALQEFALGNYAPVRLREDAARDVKRLDAAYNAAAAHAQRAVDDRELLAENVRAFIADASHELKTPLTIIMGYVGAIAEGVVTDPADEERVLGKTLAECLRMRDTIDKLIALARLDREPVNAAPFEIVSLVRAVTDLMKPLAADLTLHDRDDEPALVFGNADELREALVCIIDNAVKYAPGSPIDVRVGRAGDVAVVEVADQGPGMSPEDREHVFDRFRRGSSGAGIEGSGLGLAIAKSAVERVNGRIALASELGEGTTVRMYLPCVAGARSASNGELGRQTLTAGKQLP